MNGLKIGISNLKAFPITTQGTASTNATYGPKIDWEGAVSITATPQTSSTDFYADNTAKYTFVSPSKVEGTLTVGAIPEAIWTNIFKFKKDSDGAFFDDYSKQTVECLLAFETKTSSGGLRLQYYRVKFQRPAFSVETETDSSTVQPYELTFTALPAHKTNHVLTMMQDPTSSGSSGAKTKYAKYLTAAVLDA